MLDAGMFRSLPVKNPQELVKIATRTGEDDLLFPPHGPALRAATSLPEPGGKMA
jgi:hypothetical protein